MAKKKTEESKLSKKEIEELVVKLAKQGMTSTKIGQTLKDTYNSPSTKKVIGNKIKKILNANKISEKIPNDLQDLIKNAEALKKHVNVNKQDMSAKRGLQMTEAKIIKATNYYKRKGILSADWHY
jgi:small subunit ribosomal protein S15